MHLLCFGGCIVMFGNFTVICFQTHRFADFGWSNVAIIGVLVTGKSYQYGQSMAARTNDKAIDAGAPFKPQPRE